MSKEEMMKYLSEAFGIKNERELLEALRKAGAINIGIMTTRKGEQDD